MPYIALTEADAEDITTSGLGAPLTSTGETLETLRDELILLLGARDDILIPRYNLWINFAYIDLCSSLELDDLKASMDFPLVIGSALYKLPPEVMATRGASVIDTENYGDLGGVRLNKTDLAAYRAHPDLSDEPREYFRERNLLVFWPTPSAIRTIGLDFWIRPTKLSLVTDSPILPYEWHEAILLNARKKAFHSLQEFDKAMTAENDFVQFVRRKVTRDESEDEGRTVLSSVPRSRRDLRRNTRAAWNPDLG